MFLPLGKFSLKECVFIEWIRHVDNPVHEVVVVPAAEQAPSDGASVVDVLVAAVDVFGQPVAQQTLALTLDGPGSLPSSVTTDDKGVAQIRYVVGDEPGLARCELGRRAPFCRSCVMTRRRAGSLRPSAPPAATSMPAGWCRGSTQ